MTGSEAASRAFTRSRTSSGVGGGLALGDWAVRERVARKLGRGDVLRHFQEHRAPAPVPEMREGAGQHLGNPLDQIDVRGPLGDALVVPRRAERRRHSLPPGRLPAGEEQEGYGVGEGLGDASEGVLRAGAALHGEDADPLAVGYPAEAVGHVDAGALLAADDGPDALLSARLDQRLKRIAGHPLDALGPQYLRDDRVAVHRCAPLLACGPRAEAERAHGVYVRPVSGRPLWGHLLCLRGTGDVPSAPRKAAWHYSTGPLSSGLPRRSRAA